MGPLGPLGVPGPRGTKGDTGPRGKRGGRGEKVCPQFQVKKVKNAITPGAFISNCVVQIDRNTFFRNVA